MKKIQLIFRSLVILPLFLTCIINAQTKQDSIAIINAKWETKEIGKGITLKQTIIPQLYGVPQSISIIEIDKNKNLGIGITEYGEIVSKSAVKFNAKAAINGSFFNVKRNHSTCFLKVYTEVIDSTNVRIFEDRITGAVHVNNGKIKIIPWSSKIENSYKGKKGVVLSSGPLMMLDGEYSSFDNCNKVFVETKHPRSALCITKDKKVIFVAIDGRHNNNAGGINLLELRHFLKIIGAKDAINLDGGGSTTLWAKGMPYNGVVNYPSDNKKFDHYGEREVANIIYVR